MIYELEKEEYVIATNFFLDKEISRANYVITDNIPGKVFADNIKNPTIIAVKEQNMVYLDGDLTNSEFIQQIKDIVIAEEKEVTFMSSWLIANNKDSTILVKVLDNPLVSEQLYYELSEIKLDWRALLPKGFEIKVIDEDFLADKKIKNKDFLEDSIEESFCSSVKVFLKNSGGLCLLKGDEIISSVITSYDAKNNFYGFGIETVFEHRKNGYAAIVAAACSELCLSKGAKMNWVTASYNKESQKLAEKIGHQLVVESKRYISFLDRFQNCEKNYQHQKYTIKNFDEAFKFLDEMYQHRNVNDDQFLFTDKWSKYSYCLYFYELHEMLYITGKKAEALVIFDKAIEIGKNNPDQLQNLKERRFIESEDVIGFLEKKREKLSNSLTKSQTDTSEQQTKSI